MIESVPSVWELVERRADLTSDDLLAVDEHGRRLTFAELRSEALRVAAALVERGIGPGSKVSWQLPTWIESMVLAAALARIGAVQNPIIPFHRRREVQFMVQQLGTSLLIVPGRWRGFDFPGMAAEVQAGVPGLDVLVVDRELPRATPDRLPPPDAAAASDPTRWVLYTSGTTADPKGARHADQSLLVTSRGMCERMKLVPEDRNAIAFPFTHIGGLTLMFADLLVGCSSILVEQFGRESVDVLAREGVTMAGSGTPFNLAYLQAQREQPDRKLFPHVRAFPGGGSTRPRDLHHDMKEAFGGAGILSGYGLTETGFLAMADISDPDEARAQTEGRAYPGAELRIVHPDGTVAAPGEEGEICARGPMVMLGYTDERLDGEAFDDEGFFHTGDLGVLDAEGYLRITGRLKDIIIRKGENISASEVEDLLITHPAIEDCAVVGIPDPARGEMCCAFLVVDDGALSPTLGDLRDYLTDGGLAVYKVPERIEVVSALPKTATNKVMKHLLRDRLTEPA